MTAPTPLIAGNWKMNGLSTALAEARAVAAGIGATPALVAICPPSVLIAVLWIAFISVVFVLPPNEQAGWMMLKALAVLLVIWFGWSRARFKGPKYHL